MTDKCGWTMPVGDSEKWEGDFYTVPRTWPHTRANWRRLKLAFAGCLHAWADRIEISDHEHAMKEVTDAD